MKQGTIQQLFSACLLETGNDSKKAGNLVAEKLETLLSEGKISVNDFKFNHIAEDLMGSNSYSALRRSASEGNTQEVLLAVQSSAFPIISRVAINKALMDEYVLHSEDLSSLYTEITATKTDKEELAGFIEPEGPEMRIEQMSYEDTDLGEKNVTARMADFGRTISLTEEAIFNDVTGQLLDKARNLGQGAAQHQNRIVIQTLECLPRTAFKESTSQAFIYKGQEVAAASFYADTHNSLDGRVNKNYIASNPLTNYSNVIEAHKLFGKMKSLRGYDITVVPQVVVVHGDAEVAAWQIFNSTEFLAYGGNTEKILHNANPVGPNGLIKNRVKVVSSRYVSDPGLWYYGDPKKQLRWLWVYKPKTDVLTEQTEKAFYNKIVASYKFSYHAGAANIDYVNVIKNKATA